MASRRKRSGGRAGNQRNSSSSINQMPWRQVVNIDDPIEPLSEDGIQNIHEGVLEILENIGIEFMNPEALQILKKGGASVRGENVRIGRDLLAEMLTYVPQEFTITPRNPNRRNYTWRKEYGVCKRIIATKHVGFGTGKTRR